jgi:TRAP-type mannitol/chloroaromatic compound transport system permease large subunit
MTNPEIGILMLGLFILVVLLGFPIAFTLIAMGIFFGYYAMGRPIFDLLVTNTFDTMANDVLTAVPLFLFMGYMVERANILDRCSIRSRWRREISPVRSPLRRSSPAHSLRLRPASSERS